MKFLHTADWHLGRILREYSLLEDQSARLAQLMESVREAKADAVVIAGDIYDRSVPPAQAVSFLDDLFYTLTQELKIPVLAIAGNHDSPERLSFGNRLFSSAGLYMAGKASREIRRVTLKDSFGDVDFYLLPYFTPEEARPWFPDTEIKTFNQAFQAILEYNKQAVDMLLNSKKVDMYYVWGDIWTGSPLYIACSKANVYALEKMVENGADLNYDFSEYNAVPLIHYALNYKQYIKQEEYRELIAFLILNKINVNIKNNKGHTPLMTALKNGDIDGFNALIAGGADITIKDDDGKTALFYAEHLKGSSMLPDNEYNKIIHLLSMDNGTK